MEIKCESCGHVNQVNVGSLMGAQSSKAKARAARDNGKLGGRPKGKQKRKKRPADANALAHSVVADAENITLRVVPRPPTGQ